MRKIIQLKRKLVKEIDFCDISKKNQHDRIFACVDNSDDIFILTSHYREIEKDYLYNWQSINSTFNRYITYVKDSDTFHKFIKWSLDNEEINEIFMFDNQLEFLRWSLCYLCQKGDNLFINDNDLDLVRVSLGLTRINYGK